MHIENITIKNFKGIEKFQGEINGKNVYLIGGNGAGKTSFLDAIYCSLTGKNIPSKPVKSGNKEAEVEIDLGELLVKTKYKNGKPAQLTLISKADNKEIPSPRTYLNSLVGILDFNINTFFNLSDAEQVKYFAKVSGIEYADIDVEISEIEETRKQDKKDLTILQASTTIWKEEDATREIIDQLEAANKITAYKAKKQTYLQGVTVLGETRSKIKERYLALFVNYSEINGFDFMGPFIDEVPNASSMTESSNLWNWFSNPENQLIASKVLEWFATEFLAPIAEKTPVGGLVLNAKNIQEWLDEAENQVDEAVLLKMETDFQNSKDINERITSAKAGKETDEKIKNFNTAIEVANESISALKNKKAERISKNISVPGLTYDLDNERFLYEGLPFEKEQINTASQLIAGLKIGSMMLNDLKILKIDASLIDNVQFDKVKQWSEDNGIELFVEDVDKDGGPLQIVIDEQ